MPDDDGLPLAECSDQACDVGDELGQRVGAHPGGLVALVVAAQVRRDDAKLRRECGQLVAPGVPAFGEPVQKEDERTGAVGRAVQADAVRFDETVLDRHRAGSYPRPPDLSIAARLRYGTRP